MTAAKQVPCSASRTAATVQLSKLAGRGIEGQQHASSARTMVTLLCYAEHYLAGIFAQMQAKVTLMKLMLAEPV